MAKLRSRSAWRHPVAVGVLGTVLTCAAAALALASLREVEQRRAEARATRLATDIQRVVSSHTAVLYGLRSLHVAAEPVGRRDFHRFVAEGRLVEQYPGAQAFELARRVDAADVAGFEATVRADEALVPGGYPGFAVRGGLGDGAELWVVDFVEPMAGNEAAFGFDLGADPVRRQALLAARDSGAATITAPLRLVQETEDQRGVLVALPLYRDGALPATVAERRVAAMGAALVVYRVGDMLATVREANADLAFEIHDGDELLYASGPAPAAPTQRTAVELGGRTWAVTSGAAAGPALAPVATAALVLVVGLGASLLVAAFVFHLGAARRRAEARARVLQASDDQRRSLERDLHDGAQQRLLWASMELARAEARLGRGEDALDLVRAAREGLATSLDELRELARGIHPAVLTDHGLAVALEAVAARSPVPVALFVELPGPLDPKVEAAAYYLVCEAMANVARHAGASQAAVTVRQHDGELDITVRDDGAGGADPARGTGLRGLVDRAVALDGRLAVSSPPEGGTELRAVLPCGS